ncbi:interleukin-12 receptor subunit beta-1 [Grus japonensis]|uniref:Interleukin-12 receptor subunit beta-1 n=1 Tax=Grus japonensis TaxID=30415 RepID=A0ABC9XUC4_GRUJA
MLGWLLVVLAALARNGTPTAPSFSCWKQCGSRWFLCSWPPHGPAGNTSYLLTFCYTMPRLCQRFKVGTRTTYTLKHHQVYVLTNATAWVEARWGDHFHRTPNLTLYLNNAVKLDPPPAGMPFNKSGGWLQLQVPWPPCHSGSQPPQWEARFRRMGDHGWLQVTCKMAMAKDNSVTCALGGHGAFEVQLRHKLPHWSSYWSNWSSSFFIPEEILASPVLSYQLGKLGRDGQRVLRLAWQPAPEEQGHVTYTLRARMLACRCTKSAEEDAAVLGTEVTAHNLTLSGAEYEILLMAANAAGMGPTQRLHVPAEQHAGTLEALACYRLAVHGWTPAWGWSTFATRHHYAGNVPIHINASARDATIVLQWSSSARAACPGVLAKYLICHAAEGENVTCPQGAAWNSNLKYLGISLCLPAMAAIYQLSKKRARRLLLPPLPKPMGSKAIQFSAAEMSQGQPRPGFVEPSEKFSPAELLITEHPGKEMTDVGTRPGTPQPGPTAEEPVGCEKELPFAYRRQDVLSPVGFPLPGSTSCTSHPPGEEEEEEGRWGLCQPLVPIPLLIFDKPVIIRDGKGLDPSLEKSVL